MHGPLVRRVLALTIVCCAWAFGAAHSAPPPTYIPGVLFNGTAYELVQVDPDAPASATSLRTSPGPSWPQFGIVISGAFSPPYAFTDRHASQMFYPKDNRIYKTGLLRPGTPAPVQVSSEAAADQICSIDYAYDTPNAPFFYHLHGPDGLCAGFGDDQIKVAHLDMGPGDSPTLGRFIIAKLFDAQLRTTGWLGLDGNVLKHYDAAFGNGTAVATFARDVRRLSVTLDNSVVLLRIDDSLHAYNTVSRTLSGSLHTFVGTFIPYTAGAQDSSFTYITDNVFDLNNPTASSFRISRMPSDGSSAPVPLAAGNGIANLSLTADRVILWSTQSGPPFSYLFQSLPKAGGTPTVLLSGVDASAATRLVIVSEKTVYANVVPPGAATFSAVRIGDDGSDLVTTPNANWIGYTSPSTCSGIQACDQWPEHLLRVEGPGVTLTSFAGTLKSFSAATHSEIATLGTLPADRIFGIYRIFYGSRGTLNGISFRSNALDLFYFDANVAGSLVMVRSGGSIPTLPVPVPVVEYFNAGLDHYFITWVTAEIAKLDAGIEIKGWTRTGRSFRAYTSAQTGTSPVCRYYIPPALGDSHFYGRGTAECTATGQNNPGFTLEDPNFMHMFLPAAGVCPANTDQVYRVFSNRRDANHRYMIEKALRDQMVAAGWLAEGDGPDLVVMCAPR